jgi:hypothetical protein
VYVCIGGQEQQKLYVIVAYRPCKQSNPGDSTVNAQQKRLLIQQGEINPNPRKTWCNDMLKQIEAWANHGEVILLCDANSGLTDKDFAPFVSSSQVFDLIGGRHGVDTPHTHINGSRAILFGLGTAGATDALEASGMFCFNKGITSDHRGFFLDFNRFQLLRGDLHALHQPTARRVKTRNKKTTKKYRTEVSKHLKDNEVIKRVQQLKQDTAKECTAENYHELEILDNLITGAMLMAEQSVTVKQRAWWSRDLATAYTVTRY